MSDFINTVDVIGDEALTNSLIDRSIVEYSDNNITVVGMRAFGGCSSLTTLNLPAVSYISSYAFYSCSSLTSVSFPIASFIGDGAFRSCTSLISVNFPVVSAVCSYMFIGCTSLTTVNFPAATSIGYAAFEKCTSLTEVNFPAATNIGSSAFYKCTSLTEVNFPAVTSIGYGTFSGCTSLSEVNFPAVTTIGSSAFIECTSITSVNIPAVTSIGYGTFSGCTSLSEVNLPKVTSIDNTALFRCSALTSVNFPAVTTIGSSAFRECASLTEANFPAATSIGSHAFMMCDSLINLTLANSQVTTLVNSNVFHFTPMADSSYIGTWGSIYVPASLVTAYKTANNWSYYADRITAIVGIGSADNMILLFNATSNVSILWAGPGDRPEVVPTNISVVSSDTTIATVSGVNTTASDITFNINSLAKDGTTTITVTANIDGTEYSTSFNVRVRESMPEHTYTVEAVSGAQYGFALNSNEYYESQNKGKGNTASVCKVNLHIEETTNVYVDCINSGEPNFDYGLLSNLNATLNTSSTADSSNVFRNFKGQSSSDIQTVVYKNVSAGEHYIYCKFIKDSSQDSGNDSLQFKVRFE